MSDTSSAERVEQKEVPQMEPVFIWAPSPRCGSTLLQRLITSSGEILVCGEDRLNFEHLPKSLSLAEADGAAATASSESEGKDRKEWLEERLDRLAKGEPDVYPIDAIPAEEHIALSQKQLTEAARMYQSVAEEYGYARWGIKPTVLKPGAIRGLNNFFPNCRHLFIYRNIYDCFRSMKGQTRSGESWALDGAHGWRMYQVATLWRKRITVAHKKLDNLENFYVLKFEEFMNDKETHAARICEHLGIDQLDLSVMDVRVNSIWDEETGRTRESHYVEPGSLTDEEIDEIRDFVSPDFLERLGYEAR